MTRIRNFGGFQVSTQPNEWQVISVIALLDRSDLVLTNEDQILMKPTLVAIQIEYLSPAPAPW
jgi:hypothetical protein